jgi:hypothetical protein
MTAQIRTASLTEDQAAVVDALALKLGGVSKAVQHIIDVYDASVDSEALPRPAAAPVEAEAVTA